MSRAKASPYYSRSRCNFTFSLNGCAAMPTRPDHPYSSNPTLNSRILAEAEAADACENAAPLPEASLEAPELAYVVKTNGAVSQALDPILSIPHPHPPPLPESQHDHFALPISPLPTTLSTPSPTLAYWDRTCIAALPTTHSIPPSPVLHRSHPLFPLMILLMCPLSLPSSTIRFFSSSLPPPNIGAISTPCIANDVGD